MGRWAPAGTGAMLSTSSQPKLCVVKPVFLLFLGGNWSVSSSQEGRTTACDNDPVEWLESGLNQGIVCIRHQVDSQKSEIIPIYLWPFFECVDG